LELGTDGHPTHASLAKTIKQISDKSGHRTRVLAGYITAPGKFKTVQGYVIKRFNENRKSDRAPYQLLTNSCMTFAKSTIESAKIWMPSGMIPSPAEWMEDVQGRYPDLVFAGENLSIDYIAGEEKNSPE
jgi:hypothetical protein